MKSRYTDVKLHRDLGSGRLFMSYHHVREESSLYSGIVHRVVGEPISDEDRKIIGDVPIPRRVYAVDL